MARHGDPERVAELSVSTFWFILPSLPLFIALPSLLRSGVGFWPSMAIVVAGTLALYALMFWAAPQAWAQAVSRAAVVLLSGGLDLDGLRRRWRASRASRSSR